MADYSELPWLGEIVETVAQELKHLQERRPLEGPALERERDELLKKRKGWGQSLGDPDLPHAVRGVLQSDWAAAEARLQEIDLLLKADASLSVDCIALDPADVLTRLRNLANILADDNPTMANLELAQHIDRIDCFDSGKVIVRSCKLGIAPDAVQLLAELAPNGEIGSRTSNVQTKSTGRALRTGSRRRRRRLRVTEREEGDKSDLNASIEFVTDTYRFAGLDERWFWTDEFQVPPKGYWIDAHHAMVKATYAELEREGGKKPTLK